MAVVHFTTYIFKIRMKLSQLQYCYVSEHNIIIHITIVYLIIIERPQKKKKEKKDNRVFASLFILELCIVFNGFLKA